MFRLVLTALVIGALYVTNPGLDQFSEYAKKTVEETQSTMRAGLSGVSKITGIDFLRKSTGFGNYEMCRRNIYVASIFTVKNNQLTDSTTPVAVAIGGMGYFYHQLVPAERDQWGYLTAILVEQFGQIAGEECRTVHKA